MTQALPVRVAVYIDGFNLYFGLREANFHRYYWLDITSLAQNLLRANQVLARTKYFTARIAGPKPADSYAKALALTEKRSRQTLYLDALASRPGLDIYEGHYLPKSMKCRSCGDEWTRHEEKMTDVNIATHLLVDAFNDVYDTALVVSADSDLVPPILAVKHNFPQKRIVSVFPPHRNSSNLRQSAHAYFKLGHGTLAKSLLPDPVILPNGVPLARPATWK